MKTNKWVACWGYDQTQYSVYEEVSRKGQFVVVRSYNSWACLNEKDLYVGSKVKIYKGLPHFNDILEFEREIIAKNHNWDKVCVKSFDDWEAFRRFELRESEKNAPIRTITKVSHYTTNYGYRCWEWELDGKEIVKETDGYIVDIIDALTRRKITNRLGSDSIKINDCIRAYIDLNYDKNASGYEKQNEYTFYNGH